MLLLSSKSAPSNLSRPNRNRLLRDSLAVALGGTRTPAHDEADRTFKYKGQDVRVKEKIRVESQDPALISASAKLNALEHSIMLSRKALNIVMGRDEQLD
jgi:hypothetical protein